LQFLQRINQKEAARFQANCNFCNKSILEQINFEKVYLLCKDLSANPCREMLVGELGLPLSKHFKVKMLYQGSADY